MQRSLHDYLTGGPVRGPGTPTSDSILARLSNGEYVLPKVAVDQVGVENLEAIRRAALAKTPKLALGGPISGGLNFQSEEPTSTTFYPSGLPTASAPSFGDAIGGTNTGIKLGGSPAATPPGSLNSYGNDMSLANRMNAGAEAMRTMREGSAAPPAKPADDFATTLAKALQANDPAKQADEARKAAQAKADPLDVASGRFDREYAPGMAAGGLISQKQWEGLPRFAEGTPASPDEESDGEFDWNRGLLPQAIDAIQRIQTIPPAERTRAQNLFTGRGLSGKEQEALVPPSPKPTPLSPTGQVVSTPIPSAAPPAPSSVSADDRQRYIALEDQLKKSGGTPPPRPPSMMGPTATPTPSPKAQTGAVTTGVATSPGSVTPPAVPSFPSLIPGGSWQDLAQPGEWEQTKQALQNRNPTPAKSVMLQPGARDAGVYAQQVGGKILANGPGPGIGPQAVVAAPSRPIGTQSYTTGQPFEPSQGTAPPPPLMGSQRIMSGNGVTGPVTTGGSNVPIYQTDYTVFGPKGQQGTLSVTGPDQRVGGGTVSQPDQGNGGTVEGNVAALNRQYEAVKSRNEAYGWGGASGSALPAAPASVDMWARPGDSFGDSQMRQARYEGLLKDAANQKGLGAKRRAAAMIDAATGLLAPGAATAKLNAEQQQAANSLTGQLAQARAQQEASKYGADVGLAGHKYTADASLAGARLKAEQEAQQASRAATQKDNEISISAYRARTEADRVKKEMAGLSTAEKNEAILRLADRLSQLPQNSPEAINIRTVLQYLQPSSNQDDALAATEALIKAQAAAK